MVQAVCVECLAAATIPVAICPCSIGRQLCTSWWFPVRYLFLLYVCLRPCLPSYQLSHFLGYRCGLVSKAPLRSDRVDAFLGKLIAAFSDTPKPKKSLARFATMTGDPAVNAITSLATDVASIIKCLQSTVQSWIKEAFRDRWPSHPSTPPARSPPATPLPSQPNRRRGSSARQSTNFNDDDDFRPLTIG